MDVGLPSLFRLRASTLLPKRESGVREGRGAKGGGQEEEELEDEEGAAGVLVWQPVWCMPGCLGDEKPLTTVSTTCDTAQFSSCFSVSASCLPPLRFIALSPFLPSSSLPSMSSISLSMRACSRRRALARSRNRPGSSSDRSSWPFRCLSRCRSSRPSERMLSSDKFPSSSRSRPRSASPFSSSSSVSES